MFSSVPFCVRWGDFVCWVTVPATSLIQALLEISLIRVHRGGKHGFAGTTVELREHVAEMCLGSFHHWALSFGRMSNHLGSCYLLHLRTDSGVFWTVVCAVTCENLLARVPAV